MIMPLHDASTGPGEGLPLEGMTINPATDHRFAAAVRRAADASRSLAELEGRLRRFFPRACIRAQVSDGRGIPTWFIYRDGAWTSEPPAPTRRRLAMSVGAVLRAGIPIDGPARTERRVKVAAKH